MHQDGVLKERSTYEILKPEDVGVARSVFVLGKHSGRHAIKHRLAELGYSVSDIELIRLYHRFKELCDHEKHITDMDLISLLEEDRVALSLHQEQEI
jgi:2-isopropylmalate synthase